jgi:peptidoglycan/xylan/chitin deacetylase (PgdA/CDA1 family)
MLPRRAQIAARRVRAERIWRGVGRTPIPPVSRDPLGFPWPDGAVAGAVVTHDVETEVGQANIPTLLEIEDSFDLRSCWNFVVRRYSVDLDLIRRLGDLGHEVGVHGVEHDGKLFDSEHRFRERVAIMEEAAREWGSEGFRSPSLLYDRRLLETIPFSWDSSMPAWDPFQPKPGDCRTYVPFPLNARCIELPVTLWQDFTLFEELRFRDISVWREQIDFIVSIGGLVNVIVHPDYMLTSDRTSMYRDLLEHLRSVDGLWIAKPAEVADWARTRQSQPE